MPSPGEFGKAIKVVFKPLAIEEGFFFYKPMLLLRMHQDTLHIVSFDRGLAGFACNIAIQPLYMPYDFISLSFGARLTRFRVDFPERWDYGNDWEGLLRNLYEALELVRRNALPWFHEVGSPGGLVSFIESGAADDPSYELECPPFLRETYLAFSYLYLGRSKDAERSFRKVAQALNGNPFAVEREALAREMELLIRSNPEGAAQRIKVQIEQTKQNLSLDRPKGSGSTARRR